MMKYFRCSVCLHVVGPADGVQGQEYAEEYSLEYRRLDDGPWVRFHDRNGNEVSEHSPTVIFKLHRIVYTRDST